MKVTKIEWLDANTIATGWEPLDVLDEHGLCTVETAGFIHEETDDYMTVIQSHSENTDFQSAITIPKVLIQSRKDYA